MHRGKIRGIRRFLELKSIRETPPSSLWKKMTDPEGEGIFMQKAPLTGAETYQIYGAVHMARRYGEARESREKDLLRWVILYLLHQSGNGHIRISREDFTEDFPLWLAAAAVKWDDSPVSGGINAVLLAYPGLFGVLPDARTPIVISPEGDSFYLLKRWQYETRFLLLLDLLIGEKGKRSFTGWEEPSPVLREVFGELQEDPALLLGPETLQAAEMVSSRLLSIITGGPGTGKTTILGGLLRLLLASAGRGGETLPDIRLCAPTGRAAGRMEESLRELIRHPQYQEAFPVEPCTLHKLLGLVPGSLPRFSRNRPLPADLIVVDEASMVDLNLMYYILDALKPGARLLLVGDKDQLPSVEAGALLSDFLYGLEDPGYRLQGAVLSLSKVHRNSGAILEGAGMIIRGERDRFLSFLESPDRLVPDEGGRSKGPGRFYYGEIPGFRVFLEDMEEAFGLKALKEAVPPFFSPVSQWEESGTDIDRYFQLYRDRVILVPSRKGLFGVNSLNRGLSAHLAPGEGPVFHGQPIMITRNDYERDLFNGDRGVILSFHGHFYAFFEDPGSGGYRHFPVSLLGDYQTAFALTIHKSQGSEYRSVTVVIPEGVDRLLSREILYTGVTRAKEEVTLFSRKDLMARSLGRGVRRHSGIREFMIRP